MNEAFLPFVVMLALALVAGVCIAIAHGYKHYFGDQAASDAGTWLFMLFLAFLVGSLGMRFIRM